MEQSDATREVVFTTADHAVQVIRDLNPDLTLELDHDPLFDDRWYDCSDGLPRADNEAPQAIQWLADRTFYVEPRRETASLIDPLVAAFVAEGWQTGYESKGNGGRTVRVRKDGYTLTFGGETEVVEGRVSSIDAQVTGPCLDTPDTILDWKPGTDTTGKP